MSPTKPSTEQAVADAVSVLPKATVADVAVVAKVSRSTAAKMLARLKRAGKAQHTSGERDGARRQPDVWRRITDEYTADSPPAAAKPRALAPRTA
jgi:hypothetical protein